MSELNETEKLIANYEYNKGKTVREIAEIVMMRRWGIDIEMIENSVAAHLHNQRF